MKIELTEGRVFDALLLFQFLRKLTTPFKKTKAYKLGIIDEDGNILKSRDELETSTEKNAFTLLDLLVTNLRKFIMKFPGGKTSVATYAAALWLMKESKKEKYVDSVKLFEAFYKEYRELSLNENNKKLANINYYLFLEKAITKERAKELLHKLNTTEFEVDLEQFIMGFDAESEEHSDVADSDLDYAKIALAHLKEVPDYYTKLKELETEEIANAVGDGSKVALDEPVIRKKKEDEDEEKELD